MKTPPKENLQTRGKRGSCSGKHVAETFAGGEGTSKSVRSDRSMYKFQTGCKASGPTHTHPDRKPTVKTARLALTPNSLHFAQGPKASSYLQKPVLRNNMYAPFFNSSVLLVAVVLSPLVDEVCHRLIEAPSRKENEIQPEDR